MGLPTHDPAIGPSAPADNPQSTNHIPRLSPDAFWNAHIRPLYEAELAREQQFQDEAFADTTLTVAGFELRAMSAYDLLLLHGCGSPFVTGGPITPAHIAQFISLLVEPAPRSWFQRRRFFARVRELPYRATCAAIEEYLNRMFISSGLSRGHERQRVEDSEAHSAPALPMSFLTPLVLGIAAETGWPEREILSMRLDKLFQYRREIARRHTGEAGLPGADRWISKFLEHYNRYLHTGVLPGGMTLQSHVPTG